MPKEGLAGGGSPHIFVKQLKYKAILANVLSARIAMLYLGEAKAHRTCTCYMQLISDGPHVPFYIHINSFTTRPAK